MNPRFRCPKKQPYRSKHSLEQHMKKTLKAVAPYVHPGFLNFKTSPFEAWKENGGMVLGGCYPPRLLHGAAFRWELPAVWKNRKEARLRFVEPVSVSFDAFPDYTRYEVVPMFWDCWPCYFDKTCEWLRKHGVKTAVFSSRQVAERMHKVFPDMNIIWCAEAVDGTVYTKGKQLADRQIDLLEFGRSNRRIFDTAKLEQTDGGEKLLNHVCTRQNGKFVYTNEQLYEAMGNAKVTITLPRSMTDPDVAGDVETLTQRYWECMFSRMVMVGHAPQELVDFIGYNPVVELRDDVTAESMIKDVLLHIDDYQELVDRNRRVAEEKGTWNVRMKWLMEQLAEHYRIAAL